MHGPWRGDKSKLWMALCSSGITPSTPGRGGSYGYGKAGLIRGSAIRVVIAYTCFRERDDDPGVTRRLLGMTYWDRHEIDEISYTGSGRLGITECADTTSPLENQEADDFARALGMHSRDPASPADLGTSLLILAPAVTPRDLIRATERYWWPVLEDDTIDFHVQVVDISGQIHHPQPKQDPDLRPFIDCFHTAITPQDNSRINIRRLPLRAIVDYPSPGTLALRAQVPGWTFPDFVESDTEVEHKSLIALIRTPRMVVEYLDAGNSQPFIRGTFVADDSINEPLRRTEPKSHDAWQTASTSGDIPLDYADLAREVLKRIWRHLNRFRTELTPRPTPAETHHLPEFDRIMRPVFGGRGPGSRPPRPEQRAFSIWPGGDLNAADNGLVYVTGVAIVTFSDHYEPPSDQGEEIEVEVQYRFLEDYRIGQRVELAVEPPTGFSPVARKPNTFRGHLSIGKTATFAYLSDEYNPEWTGKVIVNADFVGAIETNASVENPHE